jgi:molybdopterin synthase catalytic subunit/molybdopterin converting factor small subunit
MEVVVKLFAGLRERAGSGERRLELAPGARAGDVWERLGLGAEPAGLLYAVNREYADPARELVDGDEVALIPPVSGGAFRLTQQPLSLDAAVAEVHDPSAGAIATFTGTVRSASRNRNVRYLEYEAYDEMAEQVMAQLASKLNDHYDVHAVAIHHRTGRVEVGEASVVIAVSAARRHAAFEACEHVIVRLKEIVPIWKKEHYADGAVWIGSEAD